MKDIKVIGIDLAKTIFYLHAMDKQGGCVYRKRVTRKKLIEFIANHPRTCLAMESCSGSHYFARKFKEWGHDVKLISAQHVKAYLSGNKNDWNDAQAIAEASTRKKTRSVNIKSIEQHDMQAILRVRDRLIRNRTGLCNQIRGFLNEYGIVVRKDVSWLKKSLPVILDDADNELSDRMRAQLVELYEELRQLEEWIMRQEAKVKTLFQNNELCQRLSQIPGVGKISSVAVISILGQENAFKRGRDFAAYLGLVPRQHSSGGKSRLGAISKRGNRYIRSLLIHGARAVVKNAAHKEDRRSRWVTELKQRRGYNKASVAVANKNARIIWALITNSEEYQQAA